MGLQRQADIEFIMSQCAYLRNLIEASAALNLNSINVVAENFFRDLLNLLLCYNLQNLNCILQNSAAIDLGDSELRFCVQVTATSEKAKLAKTVNKFVEKGLHQAYDRLVILIATKKKKYQAATISDPAGVYTLDVKKDVWDWDQIFKLTNDLPLGRLQEIRGFIEKEISVAQTKLPTNEVSTFISLMLLLSDETHADAGKGVLKAPDPDKKVEGRFSDHADYLKDQYTTYYAEYGLVLESAMSSGTLGTARLRRLGLHLATKSDQLLNACGGDPKAALEQLVEFYQKELQSHGKCADQGAIRFFMLDQLIKCHVFPMKESSGA